MTDQVVLCDQVAGSDHVALCNDLVVLCDPTKLLDQTLTPHIQVFSGTDGKYAGAE